MPPTIESLIYDKPGHLIRRLQQIAVALFMQQRRSSILLRYNMLRFSRSICIRASIRPRL